MSFVLVWRGARLSFVLSSISLSLFINNIVVHHRMTHLLLRNVQMYAILSETLYIYLPWISKKLWERPAWCPKICFVDLTTEGCRGRLVLYPIKWWTSIFSQYQFIIKRECCVRINENDHRREMFNSLIPFLNLYLDIGALSVNQVNAVCWLVMLL